MEIEGSEATRREKLRDQKKNPNFDE